jgi:gliding-associated putative ABC transporter substrate-binding component GldG
MTMKKWEDILEFTAVFLFLLLVNVNLHNYPVRIDLTEDKRFTISDATKDMLRELPDVVYVDVYLEGDLNAGFRRLQQAIRETLEEFKVYAGNKLEYQFIDPSQATTASARNTFYQQLAEKGLPPTQLFDNQDGKRVQKMIFPGAIIGHRNREEGVLLLKGNKAASPQEQLNQSIEGLEYELATSIKKLASGSKRSIAFTEGHQELEGRELTEIMAALSEFYLVDRVQPDKVPLHPYDVLIIAQPKKPFSEQEKYRLDQYLMQGGSLMFLLDKVQMNLDSIALGGTYAFGYDLNLEDMLFRYGARVNTDLIQDLRSGSIEVVTGNFGNRPQVNLLRWPYYAFINTFSNHPIVKNMDVVYLKFFSTIDTVKAEGISKTPLMFTSQYARVKNTPTMVDLNELQQDLNQDLYNRPFMPVAYLLEGQFTSHFANRFPPRGIQDPDRRKTGDPAKIIVVSDGDILRNDTDRSGQLVSLDFDRASRQALSNKDFILNAVAYLSEENGLIASRAKQVTLRPLDTFAVNEQKTAIQVFNLAVPIALVIGFGFLRHYLRKRKYGMAKG